MTLLDALVLLFGGFGAIYAGVRILFPRKPAIRLKPECELRRGARVARMDDFRHRAFVDERGPREL